MKAVQTLPPPPVPNFIDINIKQSRVNIKAQERSMF
jgi:hypothetical protein